MDCQSGSVLFSVFLILLWLSVAPPSSAADPPACPLTTRPEEISPTYTYDYSSPAFQSLFQQLNSTIEEFTSSRGISSFAVAVVHGNRTIYTNGLTSTKFRIASITKTFTALGALMLRDRGLLSIDDPVKTHLPDFSVINPYDDHDITLRELMGHASGLPKECGSEDFRCGSNETEILKEIAGMRLIRPPWSSEPAYSSLGMALLGRAWEKATSPRISWEEFVTENILKALEMSNSGVDLDGVELAPSSSPDARVDLLWSRPTAQMYSTVEDLAKYLQFLVTGEPALISQSSIREWISPATIFNDGKGGYAFPWELRKIPDFIEMVVSKMGDIYSYGSHIVFDQPNQVGVAVLTVFEPETTSSADILADAVFMPVVKTVQSVNAEFLAARYAGTYTSKMTPFTLSPTFDYKVQVLYGTITVYVNSSLGLLADAQIAIMNDVYPVTVNATWSLLLKNATENSFWFGEAPSCAYFVGAIGGGSDLEHPNEPGTLYTNMIWFDTTKGTLVWPAIGGKFHKAGSSGHLLHPSSSYLLVALFVIFTLNVLLLRQF